jgi:hypothetical protein
METEIHSEEVLSNPLSQAEQRWRESRRYRSEDAEESIVSREEGRLLDWLDQLEDREPQVAAGAMGGESWNDWKNELRRRACQVALGSSQALFESARSAIASLSQQQKKRVRLTVLDERISAEFCMDLAAHEAYRSSLVHILRNAVSHGIETPVERQALGKSPEGLIHMAMSWRDGVLKLVLQDDGRGLQDERIRASARMNGVPDADTAPLEELIFHPQVSSRDGGSRDEWAGSAVGLDAVRASLRAQGGDVRVISDEGPGLGLELALRPRRQALSVRRLVLISPEGMERSFYVPERTAQEELGLFPARLQESASYWLAGQLPAWFAFERFARGPAGIAHATPESLLSPMLGDGSRFRWAEEESEFRIFRRAERAWAAKIPRGSPGFVHQLGLAPLLG